MLAAGWMIVAAVELALSALISDTALGNDRLALGARISLAAYGLAVLVAAVGAIGGLLLLLSRLRRLGGHPAVHWTIGGVQAAVLFVAVLLYGTSWALFWNTGVFFDRQAIAFLALNGVQIYHWVYPPLALGSSWHARRRRGPRVVGAVDLGEAAGRATETRPGGRRRRDRLRRRRARRQVTCGSADGTRRRPSRLRGEPASDARAPSLTRADLGGARREKRRGGVQPATRT